jgi:hypothetical protein
MPKLEKLEKPEGAMGAASFRWRAVSGGGGLIVGNAMKMMKDQSRYRLQTASFYSSDTKECIDVLELLGC